MRRPRARAYITRHLLVPEAPQADTHECPAGAGGRHGPRGGSEPARLAPRAQTRTQGRRGVWCTRPGAPCGARSCRTRTGTARGGIPMGEGDSHGPYERPAPARRARRARTIRAWGLGFGTVTPWRIARSAQGCSEHLTRPLRARRGILMGAGVCHAPCARPAPSRHAQRARAVAPMGSKGLWCGARYDTAEHDPHADGARARPDAGRCSTCCQDSPSHARHARHARGGHCRASHRRVGVVSSQHLREMWSRCAR